MVTAAAGKVKRRWIREMGGGWLFLSALLILTDRTHAETQRRRDTEESIAVLCVSASLCDPSRKLITNGTLGDRPLSIPRFRGPR